jgi:hypothetical protein
MEAERVVDRKPETKGEMRKIRDVRVSNKNHMRRCKSTPSKKPTLRNGLQ